MRHVTTFLLAMTLIFSCTACSAVQNAPSGNSHGSEAENVENLAIVEPEKINEAEIAQQAYDLIDSAETLCKDGMGIISAAWHFGIWDAPECETDVVMERLSAQIGCDVSFIEENGGYTADELVNGNEDFGGWEFCLMAAENCLSAVGAFTSVNETLDAARDLIRELSDDYTNYQYLKDYYTKVVAYAEYFENVSGSYNDMVEAIDKYENNIQTAKEPLLFDFG